MFLFLFASPCLTFLFVTLQLWRDRVQVANIKPGVYAFDRRLPLHGQSPFRSCLRLKLLLLRFTFGILPIRDSDSVRPIALGTSFSTKTIHLQQNDKKRTSSRLVVRPFLGSLFHRTVAAFQAFHRKLRRLDTFASLLVPRIGLQESQRLR